MHFFSLALRNAAPKGTPYPSCARTPKPAEVMMAGWRFCRHLAVAEYFNLQAQAEQAAWKLAKELNVSLVTILPSYILGPVISR